MPNFGIKCFLGSFIFSLLAVFAATRGYYVLTEDNPQPQSQSFAEIKDIELFAQNEESDKIYEKFKSLSSPSQVQVPLNDEVSDEVSEELNEEYDDISDTLAFDGEQTGDIIYDPDEEEAPSNASQKHNDETRKELASAEEQILENDKDSDELIIADASEAPQFIIPLKHNFGTTSISGTSVSSSTENGPTALASQNVNAQAQIKNNTDIETNPWETAEVGNRYITKNKMNEFEKEHKEDMAALDKEKNSEAKSENETKVAYKMVKNILIPIPDEIANDENLTPQLSYSAKNKKIDANLKKKQSQENTLKGSQTTSKQTEKIDDAQSKSLTDSITDWFAQGNKNKEKINIVAQDDESSKTSDEQSDEDYDDDDDEGNAFSRLLGLKKKKKNTKTIIPSELKLSFQPNRAEISGQTLEWLRAFSQNAVKDDDVMVEIRIDGSCSYELQQKRLNLLYTIFANNGVNYDKINIIFTARDPNSFIIRNVKYAAENTKDKAENKRSGPWY